MDGETPNYVCPPLTASVAELETAAVRVRALGAYLAFACGDALGATVEFLTRGEIQAKYGTHNRIIGGGWLNLKPGQVTDDTQMSLAMGGAIVDCGGWDLGAVAQSFADWLASKPIDCGATCRRGIRRFIVHNTLEGPYSDGDAGNGAVMRNLPVAISALGAPDLADRWALEQARLTHNHELSDAATIAFGRMVQALVLTGDKQAARAIADDLVSRHRQFRFEGHRGQATAYVVDTVRTVLRWFFETETLEDCIVSTVNQGDDADTTGALAGMLAGALYGARAIPHDWLNRLDRGVLSDVERQTDGLLDVAIRNRSKSA